MKRPTRLATYFACVFIGYLHAQAPKTQTINEDDLLKGIRAGLGTEELVRYVQTRGVDFLLTPNNRKRFVDAKASQKLIDALDATIREQAGIKCPEPKDPEPVKCPAPVSPPPFAPTAGPALSRSEVSLLLQANVPVGNVLKLVEARGVNFQGSLDSAMEIRASGGNAELNGFIAEHYKAMAPPPAPVATSPPPVPISPPVSSKASISIPTQTQALNSSKPNSGITMQIVAWTVQRSKATKSPQPAYPEQARSMKASGIVAVTILINIDGKVKSAVANSGPEALRPASVDAARRWEFQKTLINGVPVEVTTEILFNFVLPK